jgi:hypothetical protein
VGRRHFGASGWRELVQAARFTQQLWRAGILPSGHASLDSEIADLAQAGLPTR